MEDGLKAKIVKAIMDGAITGLEERLDALNERYKVELEYSGRSTMIRTIKVTPADSLTHCFMIKVVQYY